jgi:membrane dipeptidase
MERLGMVIDVSHGSDALFFQVAELAKKPFVASHSNARAVCGHTRNMRDDMIRLLADKGGVMGLNIGPDFLAEGSGGASRVEDMVRQILYIRKVGGSGVLALGSDFDGVRGDFEIAGPQDWPKLADALRKAGLPEDELEGMWWRNADRVLREALA